MVDSAISHRQEEEEVDGEVEEEEEDNLALGVTGARGGIMQADCWEGDCGGKHWRWTKVNEAAVLCKIDCIEKQR